MGLRDRLEQGAAKVGEGARAIADSEHAQRAGESFRGFKSMLGDDEQQSAEGYLLALVRAVRDDEEEDERSRRDVYVTARKRRRRLGLLSFGAGPMAGVASRVADLYCEVAVVCDVAELHGLDLGDEEVAAQMLVMWSVIDDLDIARGAMRSEPPLAAILGAQLLEQLDIEETPQTKLELAKAIWQIHSVDAGDVKEAASGQPIRSVAFTGHRTKKLIKRAEAQLGVS
jgi:hypothetical protein